LIFFDEIEKEQNKIIQKLAKESEETKDQSENKLKWGKSYDSKQNK
jgi:hypothetical protein